jgi:hypothetical protein
LWQGKQDRSSQEIHPVCTDADTTILLVPYDTPSSFEFMGLTQKPL